MNSFEDLETWKAAVQLRKDVKELIQTFPKEEKFRLTDQLIRSSRSISANIAEGFGRFHYQENIQFCRQARGSLTESLDHIICACDEGYIDKNDLLNFRRSYEKCLKLINGYIAYLKKAKSGTQ